MSVAEEDVNWGKYENPDEQARHIARKVYWESYDKDTHKCQKCGSSDKQLEIHHIDENPYNNALINLIGLCHSCHVRFHRAKNIEDRMLEMRKEAYTLGE